MASSGGISIKSLKNFEDHEGFTIYQGNVYKNGRKLGFWSQDSWGGPDTFCFDEKELSEAIAHHRESGKASSGFMEFPDAEMLMVEIVHLAEDEKLYKKAAKSGYSSLLIATDGYHLLAVGTNKPEKETAWFVEECRKEFFKDWDGKVTTYRSLEDFDI